MGIRFAISKKFNIAFVFCEGQFTAQEYFRAMQSLHKQSSYRHGILKIVDLYSAEEEFDLTDMRESLAYNQKLADQGIALDHTVLLSNNDGMKSIVETMKLLSHGVSLQFDVFSTLEEAIEALGRSAQGQEISDLYEKLKNSK